MNGAHLHLILNHIPILGSAFALLLLIYGRFFKDNSILNSGLATIILTALFSIPVYLTGEEAEHAVDGMLAISLDNIETHEDQAEAAFWAMLMSGAIALGTLLSARSTKQASSVLVWINMILLLIVMILMFRVGYSGGLIHHPEINAEQSSEVSKNHEDSD